MVTVGEPLPTIDEVRPYRTGILSSLLSERGHAVTWWSTTFDHTRKVHRFSEERLIRLSDGRKLQLLKGPGYKRNVSPARVLDHSLIAYSFARRARFLSAPDIVICSYPTVELSWSVYRFCTARKIPYILDIRDLWPDIYAGQISRFTYLMGLPAFACWNRMASVSIEHCSALVAVSEGYLNWGLRKGQRRRSEYDSVVPLAYPDFEECGRDGDECAHELSALGIDTNKLLILFVGTFGATYDLSTPIRAIDRLPSTVRNMVQFVFCGDGERASTWREMAAKHENIVFTGWLDENRLRCVMRAADIGLAAYAEGAPQGIPNKIIEYMAASLPILSSLTGETAQLLDGAECGISYKAADVGGFVDSLSVLLGHDVRARMSENSTAAFRKRFSAADVYRRYVDLVERLVRRGLGPRSGLPITVW